MKKETYVVPESEEMEIRFEENYLSSGEGTGEEEGED